jgi:hypothetical protein
MERNVTNSSIDRLNNRADRLNNRIRPVAHEHAPTPTEIQRWEDDGGAILPDAPDRRVEQRHGRVEPKLAAA